MKCGALAIYWAQESSESLVLVCNSRSTLMLMCAEQEFERSTISFFRSKVQQARDCSPLLEYISGRGCLPTSQISCTRTLTERTLKATTCKQHTPHIDDFIIQPPTSKAQIRAAAQQPKQRCDPRSVVLSQVTLGLFASRLILFFCAA